MHRRRFLCTVGSGIVGGALAEYPSAYSKPIDSGAFSFLTKPYLQNPTANSMTIRWITNKPSNSWVEYGNTTSLDKKAFGTIDGLKTSGRIQDVTLEGLAPNTQYFYRVVSKQIINHQAYHVDFGPTITSAVFSFSTLATSPKKVRFSVYNDIHQEIGLWKKLSNQIVDFNPDFSVLNGDIMNHIDSEESLIDNMIAPAAEIFGGNIPYYFVRGNHETRGVFSRELARYLSFPKNRYYFARTIGPVRLIVLDSGEDKKDSNKEYFGLADFDRYRSVQQEWLRHEITLPDFKNAAFRIVIHHIPILPTPDWPGTHDCFKKWAPLFEEGKVDLFIGGHTHRYEIIPPSEKENRPYSLAIGGGPKSGEAVVMTVEADEKELRLNMIDNNGKAVKKRRIVRKFG